MYSLIIKNAKVVDGTGKTPEILDLAVEKEEIVNITKNLESKAENVIDANGLTLTPGFIDIQNHSDSYWQIFDNPLLDSLVTQGYTTILIGNCGGSLAPLLSREALLSIQKWHKLTATNINWQSFEEYLNILEKQKFGCNIANLIGYSTLRRGIIGDQIRSLEKEELRALTEILENSLRSGAFGLSTGLSYAHEIIISGLEILELAKILKKYDGLLSVHLRNEGDEIIEALDEALEIARATDVNLKISHLKVRNKINWNKQQEIIELFDNAYHKNIKVHFDVYPYEKMWQPLYSYLPKWAIEGGRKIILRHLSDRTQKNKILMFLNSTDIKYSELLIASTENKLNFVGKTLGRIAKNLEVTSEEALLYLIEHGGSEVLVFEKNMDENNVKKLLTHPLSFIGTDGAGFNIKNMNTLVHPRCFGTAPKYLKFALKSGIAIEQAIKKLSSGPAKKMGLKKRGEIKIGNFADLVLINEKEITDKATYENPYKYSKGIEYVFVNGKITVKDGTITENLPGKILRKT